MSPFAIAVLAVSMSVDAIAVSVGRGAAMGRPRFSEALRTGVVFGLVEAITPVIGWIAGVAASQLSRPSTTGSHSHCSLPSVCI